MSESGSFDWRGRRVLVTGASGFIGRHLCRDLLRQGAKVVGFSFSGEDGGYPHFFGDVSDRSCVQEAFNFAEKASEGPIEFLFHLAAQKSGVIAKREPYDTLKVSLLGALNVLELSRPHRTNVVLVSSLAVYGQSEDRADSLLRESMPSRADSIYAASKIAVEDISLAYHRDLGLPVRIARLANVYGPGQSPEAVIPSVIAQALSGEKVALGNTSTVRDFVFVGDVVEALKFLAHQSVTSGRIFNVGTGQGHSIEEVVQMICQTVGYSGTIAQDQGRLRAGEKSVIVPDVSELLRAGWRPRWDIKTGIVETIKIARNAELNL